MRTQQGTDFVSLLYSKQEHHSKSLLYAKVGSGGNFETANTNWQTANTNSRFNSVDTPERR